jgi:hypothetical protein
MICMPGLSACRTLAAASVAAAALLTAPLPAMAQGAFNGTWSVLIITSSGDCDRAYRYPVRVANGRVTYGGQADFNVSGRVAGNGAVNVTVSKGNQRANGSGRLAGGSGSGTWRGTGNVGTCSGTWTAEKRG